MGGVLAELRGGKFGHGFVSAGVTKGLGGAFMPGGGDLSAGQVAKGTAISAVIGGTASALSGGKFANGATTGAFQFLYNQAARSCGGRPCVNRGKTSNTKSKRWALQLGLTGAGKKFAGGAGEFGFYVGINRAGNVDIGLYGTLAGTFSTGIGGEIGAVFAWGDVFTDQIAGPSVLSIWGLDTPFIDLTYTPEILKAGTGNPSGIIHNFYFTVGLEGSVSGVAEIGAGTANTWTTRINN